MKKVVLLLVFMLSYTGCGMPAKDLENDNYAITVDEESVSIDTVSDNTVVEEVEIQEEAVNEFFFTLESGELDLSDYKLKSNNYSVDFIRRVTSYLEDGTVSKVESKTINKKLDNLDFKMVLTYTGSEYDIEDYISKHGSINSDELSAYGVLLNTDEGVGLELYNGKWYTTDMSNTDELEVSPVFIDNILAGFKDVAAATTIISVDASFEEYTGVSLGEGYASNVVLNYEFDTQTKELLNLSVDYTVYTDESMETIKYKTSDIYIYKDLEYGLGFDWEDSLAEASKNRKRG